MVLLVSQFFAVGKSYLRLVRKRDCHHRRQLGGTTIEQPSLEGQWPHRR